MMRAARMLGGVALLAIWLASGPAVGQRIRIPVPEPSSTESSAPVSVAAVPSTTTTAGTLSPAPTMRGTPATVASQITVPPPGAVAPGPYPAPAGTTLAPAPGTLAPAPGTPVYPAPGTAPVYPAPAATMPPALAPAPSYVPTPGSPYAPAPVVTVPAPGVRIDGGIQPAPRAYDPYAAPCVPQDIVPPYLSSQCYQGFEGGAEIVFLRPYLGDTRTVSATFPPAVPGGARVERSYSFSQNAYDVSPRIWLGYVISTGLGFRARYWQFDHSIASENFDVTFDPAYFVPLPGTASTRVAASGRLKADTLDAEVSQVLEVGPWHTLVGGGLRYAEFEHDLTVLDAFSGAGVAGRATTHLDHFYGLGPTLFAELRRPLGNSGFSLVANGRGSLLFGSRRLSSGSEGLLVSPFLTVPGAVIFPAGATFATSAKEDATVSIGEIQLGVEWARRFPSGAHFFIDALWEGQIWHASGSSNALASSDLGLMGFSLGIGLRR